MMLRLLLNIAMTVVWMVLWQSTSPLNAVLGFVISALVITISARVIGREAADEPTGRVPASPLRGAVYALRLVNILLFAGYFLYILVKANLGVAWEILTPGYHMKPRMIRYPVDGLTPAQVTVLANAITLTPGTLSADVDDAGRNLYIHAMYAEEKQDAIAELDKLRHKLLWLVFGRKLDDTEPTPTPPAGTASV